MAIPASTALPLHIILAALLWLLAAGPPWHGLRRVATGLCAVDHPESALHVVRGLRGVIVAVSFASLGGGVLWASMGLVVFGLIFLGGDGCGAGAWKTARAARHAGPAGVTD